MFLFCFKGSSKSMPTRSRKSCPKRQLPWGNQGEVRPICNSSSWPDTVSKQDNSKRSESHLEWNVWGSTKYFVFILAKTGCWVLIGEVVFLVLESYCVKYFKKLFLPNWYLQKSYHHTKFCILMYILEFDLGSWWFKTSRSLEFYIFKLFFLSLKFVVHEIPGQDLEVDLYDEDPDKDDFLGRW